MNSIELYQMWPHKLPHPYVSFVVQGQAHEGIWMPGNGFGFMIKNTRSLWRVLSRFSYWENHASCKGKDRSGRGTRSGWGQWRCYCKGPGERRRWVNSERRRNERWYQNLIEWGVEKRGGSQDASEGFTAASPGQWWASAQSRESPETVLWRACSLGLPLANLVKNHIALPRHWQLHFYLLLYNSKHGELNIL